MRDFLRRWGAPYLLVVMFVASWVGQYVAQVAEGDGWTLFLASTFENWQSEFLQLAVQTLLVVAAADKLFVKSKEDTIRIQDQLNQVLDNQVRLDRMIASQIRAGKN